LAAQIDRHLLKKAARRSTGIMRAACERWPGAPITLR